MSRKRKKPSQASGGAGPALTGEPVVDPLSWWVVLGVATVIYLALFCQTKIGGDDGVSRGMLYLLLPFDPGELIRNWIGGDWNRVGVLDRVPILAIMTVWILAAQIAGTFILRCLRVPFGRREWIEQIGFAAPIGLQALSLVVLLIGLLAGAMGGGGGWLLSRWPLLAIVLALAAAPFAAPRWFAPWHPSPAKDENEEEEQAARGEKPWLLILAAPFALLLIGCSMLPPWEFDVREYHLQAPKEWYRGGGVAFLPHNVYANMPLGAEMHAFAGMILIGGEDGWWRGALVGKGVIGAMNLLTAIALFAAAARRVGAFGGAAAALLYLSWPFAIHVASAGLIDASLALYITLAFLAMLRFLEEDDDEATSSRWVWVAAIAAGGAASCKYPGLLLAVAPAAAMAAVVRFRRSGAASAAKTASAFLAIALLVCSPWLLKNFAQTGNPTYPLLAEVFGGETRTAEKNEQWRKAHATPADTQGRSFTPIQWSQAATQILWRFQHNHPLIVPLAVVALVVGATRRSAAFAWLAVGVLFVLWFAATHRIDRFWLPIGPLLCFAAGLGAGGGRSEPWRNIVSLLLALASALTFTYAASRYATPDNRLLVAYSELRRDLPNQADPLQWTLNPAHDFLNQNTEPDGAVLLVGDAQPFDLTPKAFYSTCFDDCVFETWIRGQTAAERQKTLGDNRVELVLVNWSEIARYRATYGFTDYVQPEVFAELEREGTLTRVDYEGAAPGVEIYRVADR